VKPADRADAPFPRSTRCASCSSRDRSSAPSRWPSAARRPSG
jgi:hypothetical protein